MGDKAKAAAAVAADFKAMFTELPDGTKRDILEQVKEPIDQVYPLLWSPRFFNPRQRIIQLTTYLQAKLINLHSLRNPNLTKG